LKFYNGNIITTNRIHLNSNQVYLKTVVETLKEIQYGALP